MSRGSKGKDGGDSYAGRPRSVGELRVLRGDKHTPAFTPRDCLISALRMIDEGMDVSICVVTLREHRGEAFHCHYAVASPDFLATIGLLEHTIHTMLSNQEDSGPERAGQK